MLIPGDPSHPPIDAPDARAACRRGGRRRGFTLIETALTMVIIGVGILSMMSLSGALTGQNAAAGQTTTAMLLASNVQEAMAGLSFNDPAYASTYFGPEPGETLASYNDVDDFDGKTFGPPIDAARQPVAALARYSQVVSVVPVYANRLNSNTNPASPDLPKTTVTGVVRVTVRIMHRQTPTSAAREVYRASWIRTAS